MAAVTLGVDVSARWFDVARGPEVRRFPNTAPGIAACLGWVAGVGQPARIGLEATGTYHLPLAAAVYGAGHTVLVCNPLNPLSIARYSEAVLARTKTDATDARRIARFCETHALVPWRPASPAHQRLHALVATRQALLQQLQQLRNREGAAGYTACQTLVTELQAPVAAALTAQVARIDRELAQLAAAETPLGTQLRALVSIPGLGRTAAAAILASLPVERLATRRQVAAYAGLCPRERTSGSSIRGRGRTGPLGPAALRKALYLPAVVAMRANPALRGFAERLRAAGKCPKVVVVAVMRKLLELAWTLLRNGQTFTLSQGTAASTP
jgi:transposase